MFVFQQLQANLQVGYRFDESVEAYESSLKFFMLIKHFFLLLSAY